MHMVPTVLSWLAITECIAQSSAFIRHMLFLMPSFMLHTCQKQCAPLVVVPPTVTCAYLACCAAFVSNCSMVWHRGISSFHKMLHSLPRGAAAKQHLLLLH